jgi:hypothetical protein
MAAKGATLVTMADVAKGTNKQIGKVAEVLVLNNAMLEDVKYQEMNEGTIHTEDIRSALPAVYYRKANQAIPASKTTIESRSFSGCQFESKSQIDRDVASRGGEQMISWNRWNQAQGHLQSHANELANLMIYGSPVDSNRKAAGLFDVFSTVSASEETSKQVIDAGGTTSGNCSILKVHWGENSVFGIYPKGTTAGLKRNDHSAGNKLVKIAALDSAGNAGDFWGYEEEFITNHGLVVKDYRQACRIANIDVANLVSGVGAADLIDLMISADYKIHNKQNGSGAWYVNRTIYAHLHKQSRTAVGAGAGLTYENYQGKPVLMFLGCPVRLMDSMLNTEARVV